MDFDILELLSQSVSSLRLHPVLVTVQEIYLNFGLYFRNHHLNASSRLQRPVKQQIKPFLTVLVLPEHQLQIFFPDHLLVLGQLQTLSQYSIHDLVANYAGSHRFRWPDMSVVNQFCNAKENS